MSHHPPSPPLSVIVIFSLLPVLHSLPVLPNPDPSSIIQSFHPNPAPPATIPSFPEQSAVAACPVNLPDQLFPAVKSSCIAPSGQQLSRSKCCPVLAAWLYSSYSDAALYNTGSTSTDYKTTSSSWSSSEMPLLPDDSETCVDEVEKAMRNKGVNLVRPNETCDVLYCYCGIRLHPLSCPQAFHVSLEGKLVGDARVSRLENDCLSSTSNGNGLARCSTCLNSLYSLKKSTVGSENATGSEGRTRKMHGMDCELLGLTWLLKKDRNAYMATVTAVMRALMLNSDNADPQSCSLSSDGMPLAVDSVEINNQSSSAVLRFCSFLCLFFLSLVMYTNF